MLPILHFSDVLCVFAYVGQVRLAELKHEFEGQLSVQTHFCQVFGDTRDKIVRAWEERGGFAGYNRHVLEIAGRFEHVRVHPEVWIRNPPTSSLSPHLFVKAIQVLESEQSAPAGLAQHAADLLRVAFFEQARDIGHKAEQMALAEGMNLDRAAIERVLDSGAAHAALARDFDLVRKHDVQMSPTLIFNEGRQRLNGNVGFRIMAANVRELLRTPHDEASWC